MPPASLRVPGADGLELGLVEWSRAGVPLLLLHGFGHHARVWDELATALAPYYRTLALDWRGHGESAWDPDARYELEDFVRDLEAVTTALGLDRLVLIGHSLGGRAATLFAGRHPERMAGLVLVDVGPELDRRGLVRIRVEADRGGADRFASPEAYAATLRRAYPGASRETLERFARFGLRRGEDGRYRPCTDPALRRRLLKLDAREAERREGETARRLWEALERVPCPTLVVRAAASDVLAPEVADRMIETLPRGRLAVVPRAGHPVMLDNPEGLVEAVSAFALADA